MQGRSCCDIRQIKASRSGGLQRVSAVVCGHEVWFESAAAPLTASAEAFGSCFVIPALHTQRSLYFDGPICSQWRTNVNTLLPILHEWWGYSETLAIESNGESIPGGGKSDQAQCFSGGIDSFYSLLRGNHATRYLVCVHGYDIPYRDGYRMRKFLPSFYEICRATGKVPVVVRTNLRKHPLFSHVSWERTCGSALAAIGHLLSGIVGRLVIASSYSYGNARPWGSRWDIDPLWSSENLKIFHDDATLCRTEKLKLIAKEPLVQQHLRVCYENFSTHGNCSRCDKCVRTMIALQQLGVLPEYRGFDQRRPLAKIIDSLAPLCDDWRYQYERAISEGMSPELEAAVRRLLARSQPPRYWRVRRTVSRARVALSRICDVVRRQRRSTVHDY